MFWLFNYFALFLTATIGIVVFDDNPTGVSPQEWVLFAVMLYAALSFVKCYRTLVAQSREPDHD
jgi:hypothetical protein